MLVSSHPPLRSTNLGTFRPEFRYLWQYCNIHVKPKGAESSTYKQGIKKAGLEIKDGDSAIVPVMLYDAKLAQEFAAKLLDEGIYVTGFFYPVVPKGQARIRVQLSAAHTKAHLDKALAAFEKVGKELGVIK